MTLAGLVALEFLKLKGTLASHLCIVAPSLAAVMAALIAARQPQAEWSALLHGALGLWAYFVLPMTITALSALIAQIEHAPRTWDHILTMPVARWRVYAAKAAAMMGLVFIMSALLIVVTFTAGAAIAIWAPKRAPTGSFPWLDAAALASLMILASFFVSAIQLWIALRFRSFVAPLAVGLAGTFVVVAGMGAKELAFLPWAMPINLLTFEGANPVLALLLGGGGGLVAFALMVTELSRRETP